MPERQGVDRVLQEEALIVERTKRSLLCLDQTYMRLAKGVMTSKGEYNVKEDEKKD